MPCLVTSIGDVACSEIHLGRKVIRENKKPSSPRAASPVTHASDCIPPDSVTISSLILCIHPLDTGPSVPNPYPPCQGRFGRPVWWRRGRDSNPRDAYAPNGFQDRRIRPLCHLSVATKRPPAPKKYCLNCSQFNSCRAILKAHEPPFGKFLRRVRKNAIITTAPDRNTVSPNRNRLTLDLTRSSASISSNNLSPCPHGVHKRAVLWEMGFDLRARREL